MAAIWLGESGSAVSLRNCLQAWPSALKAWRLRLDQKDRALAELKRARLQRDTLLVLLDVDPRLDPVRSDPRFAEFRQSWPLPPAS